MRNTLGRVRSLPRSRDVISTTVALCVTMALILVVGLQGPASRFSPGINSGAFNSVIPWKVMATAAGSALGLSLFALSVDVVRFWRDTNGRVPLAIHRHALRRAIVDI